MANIVETLIFNVKSNIGQVGKDAANAAGEIKIMGVSLNSVKAGFVKAGAGAKAMFGSIKAGLISTGIGAFIIAVGSLVSYFTNTKRGADKLSQAFAGIGAITATLIDRFSSLGEGLSLIFSGEWRKGADILKNAFKGIIAEAKEEAAIMIELEKRVQALRDAELEFAIQKAETRQEIERARLIAEDETKSAKERLDNLKKALELEKKTTDRELELARERVAIQNEQMKTSENLTEDEAKLAQLKVELIEKETASIKMRRRVVTEVNALDREIHAESMSRLKERKEADAEIMKGLTLMPRLTQENSDGLIQADNDFTEQVLINAEKRKQTEADILQAKRNMVIMGLNLAAKAGEEGNAIAKALAVRQAAIAGREAILNTFVSASKNPIATVFPPYPYVMAAGAGLFAAAEIKAILSETPPTGGTDDVSTPSIGVDSQTPAPQMMSGAFELSGGVAPEPLRAYVVTDEMTNSQNQLANIRRRATI